MLKKLLKHEYKATGRFFLPAYGIFTALLVVERLSMLAAQQLAKYESIAGKIASVIMVLFSIATVLGLIALIASPMVYAVIRFYRNMLGDEGYLTHTLPVATGSQIWSKLLTAASWEILTVLVTVVCGALFFLTVDPAETKNFFMSFGDFFQELNRVGGGWAVPTILLAIVVLLSQLCTNFLTLYSAMSIGGTANKHKLLASAGTYVGIQFATSSVLQAIGIAVGMGLGKRWEVSLNDAMNQAISRNSIGPWGCQVVCKALLVALLINVLLSVLHFCLSRYFLSKKLNLA